MIWPLTVFYALFSTNHKKSVLIFDGIAQKSKQPAIYLDMGVPDTLEGRFEVQCLLSAFKILELGTANKKLGQALFDRLFENVELSLRESGVGDMSIGKRMRKLMQGFNGRIQGLHNALEMRETDPKRARSALEDHLKRNLYGADVTPTKTQINNLIAFLET